MRTLLMMVGLAFVGACGGATSNMRRCPDSPNVPCLTGEECSIDAERDCEMCRCAEPYGVREEQQDPIGPASPE